MRGWTLMLVVGVSLAGATRSAAAERTHEEARAEATITLHVANYRRFPRPVLDGARARVEKVYAAIGVHTVWTESEDPATQSEDGSLHLTVLLLSHDMAKQMSTVRLAEGVLGLSHLPLRRVYVFCDRIAAAPGDGQMLPVSLGNIIAHEIGHFLLGVRSHSANGIMRANVDLHALHLHSFDDAQVRTIHTKLVEVANRRMGP